MMLVEHITETLDHGESAARVFSISLMLLIVFIAVCYCKIARNIEYAVLNGNGLKQFYQIECNV